MVVADIDRDGDLDVVSSSFHGDGIDWYENDGSAPPRWGRHSISTIADGAESVFAADLDDSEHTLTLRLLEKTNKSGGTAMRILQFTAN